jgi:putative PIN family toxin of toxin-antitoxin system
MHIVADTNVLLRMAAAESRSPLFVAWRTHGFELVFSLETTAELVRVMAYDKVRKFLPRIRGERFLVLIQQHALFVTPATEYPRCRDPKDSMIIATAVGGKVDYLVTIDKDIYDDEELVIALYEMGIIVLQPGKLFPLLGARE